MIIILWWYNINSYYNFYIVNFPNILQIWNIKRRQWRNEIIQSSKILQSEVSKICFSCVHMIYKYAFEIFDIEIWLSHEKMSCVGKKAYTGLLNELFNYLPKKYTLFLLVNDAKKLLQSVFLIVCTKTAIFGHFW